MAKFYEEVTEKLAAFIAAQQVFFTATAPITGRINLSPKGMDTFRVLTPKLVGYLDLTGSGNETGAHLREDGRMTVMFCSFGPTPTILRLYGTGRTASPGSAEWEQYCDAFPDVPGARQLVLLAVDSLQTSCGFGVPVAEGMRPRPTLEEWAEKKGPEKLKDYQEKHNLVSIDGLETGLTPCG